MPRNDEVPTESISVRSRESAPASERPSTPSQRPRAIEPERTALLGTILDQRYVLHHVLGAGGSGLVIAATRLSDNREVAIKMLHARHAEKPAFVRALLREADVATHVRVPGLVPCLATGTLADGSPYAVFERIHGVSFSRLARRLGGLRQREAIAIVMRVAETLDALHRHGVVHRDVKPEHILVRAGELGRLEIMLLDLGSCVSVATHEEVLQDSGGYAVGTPEYMAPEQARGSHDVDARVDVYALGVVLYQMLSGRMPFESATRRTLLDRVTNEDPPRLALIAPHVSLSLDAVISQSMERENDRRFSSMNAFITALRPFAKERVQAEQRLFWLVAERPRVARRGRIITARGGQAAPRSMGRVLNTIE